MFHMVRPAADYIHAIDRLRVSPKYFEQFLLLHSRKEEFISIDEVPERIKKHKRGDRPFAVITFDDGYDDNFTYAYPILKKLQIPFVIYVAVNLVNDHAPIWNYPHIIERIIRKNDNIELENGEKYQCQTEVEKDETFRQLQSHMFSWPYKAFHTEFERIFGAYLTEDVFPINTLTWEQIKQLADDPLCTIGAHSISHCRLNMTERKDLLYEILNSKRAIEKYTEKPVSSMSYPYGAKSDVSNEAKCVAQEVGYVTALMSGGGPIREKDMNINMNSLKRTPVVEW